GPGQTLGNRSALQFIESDRQVPDALARCVIDRVGDGGGDTDDTNLTYALDAERIDAVIDLIDEDHPDVVHVGIHGHMILGDVGIHDATEIVIDQRLFVQCHADTPHHAAHDL